MGLLELEQSCYDINQNIWRFDERYVPKKISLKVLKKYRQRLNAWNEYQTIQKKED